MKISISIILFILLTSTTIIIVKGYDEQEFQFFYLEYEPKQCLTLFCPQYLATIANTGHSYNIVDIKVPSFLKKENYFPNTLNLAVYGKIVSITTESISYYNLYISDIFESLAQTETLSQVLEPLYSISFSGLDCKRSINDCPQFIISMINNNNFTNSTLINSFIEPYSSTINYFDREWYYDRLVRENDTQVLVQGEFSNDNRDFKITSSYILLENSKCQDVVSMCHESNPITVYHRDHNRCLKPQFCIDNVGPCLTKDIPNCPLGYKLSYHPSDMFGCPKYYCDPYFLPVIRI
ncbi:hypothetical protein CYY_002412 [Polysphondylium violaceum]|uniref:Uncharacterized protein n=1 Tax=Polysphondylium violaceum TaxID=133409 RepID=A0A8J4Q092_9MYCE|nr:hypothetical protein CYY_002412 [Polysphondylium violaceum]